MPTTTKFYHRGRRISRQKHHLTAVIKVELEVNTKDCEAVSQPIMFDPEIDSFALVDRLFSPAFTDESDLDPFQNVPLVKRASIPDNSVTLASSASEPVDGALETIQALGNTLSDRAREDADLRQNVLIHPVADQDGHLNPICIGTVSPKLTVEISSPIGKGNGDSRIGPVANQYGLVYAGQFHKFQGGSRAPGSEHWHVHQSIELTTIPCKGGPTKVPVLISRGIGLPPDLIIDVDIVIEKCGKVTKQEATLKLGSILNNAPIKEVKHTERLCWPLKNPQGRQYIVGSTGQPAGLF